MNQQRLTRVLAHMKEQGLSQIIISATPSLYYLTGLWVEPMERMLALYLDADGKAVLFANEIFGLSPQPGLPLVTHKDGENPVKDLAKAVAPGKLGIDKFYLSKFLIGILEARPDVRPVLGSAPVDLARMHKDADEIAAMIHSSQINDQAMAFLMTQLIAGVREDELEARLNGFYRDHGANQSGPQLVCFGANGADPHHGSGPDTLTPGTSIIFDIFTPIHRYWCDMTRTVFWGKKPTDKEKEVYELVREANAAAEALVKPGVLLSDLDAAARNVITRGGYGPQFTHRLGHGCGLECHEPPDVSAASPIPVEEGMVFSIEPGIYLPGEFGVRIEDLVLVTKDGCRVLNAHPKELTVL